MRLTKRALFLVILASLILVVPAFAFSVNGGGYVDVVVDGSRFWQDGTEEPIARLHDAMIYFCDGSQPMYYYEWYGGGDGHPDETWFDTGKRIAYLDYWWHYDYGGGADFGPVRVYGNCGNDDVVVSHMYLLTSETGFPRSDEFVNHTCSIVSEVGPPSTDRIVDLCNGLPDDFERVCDADVIDDGTDMGRWGCDGMLSEQGERRLYLYDDPYVSDKDLMDVIEMHQGKARALGLID